MTKAKIAMEQERQRVLSDAREEIASLVILTTSKVLQKELSEEEKQRYSATAVEKLRLD